MENYYNTSRNFMIGFIGILIIACMAVFFPNTLRAQTVKYTAVETSKGFYDGSIDSFVWKPLRPCNIPIEVCGDSRTITIKTKPWITLTWYTVETCDKNYFIESTTDDGIYVIISDVIELSAHMLYLNYPDYVVRYKLKQI